MKKQNVEYRIDDRIFEGYYAYDEQKNIKSPAILIAHDWSGKNEFTVKKADQLAELGYAAFALDMFGKGKTGKTKEEKVALIQPLMKDRIKLLHRIKTAYDEVKKLEGVDPNRIGAIGFCFGGLCVLDLARSGVDLSGVVSFHGLLNAPENLNQHTIKARILALHGFDDPMVTPDQVMQFGTDMTHAKADWQLHIYGNTMHAFTNPNANDPVLGTVYHPSADKRSWREMLEFFQETWGAG